MKWVGLFVLALAAAFVAMRPVVREWIEDELEGRW